MLSKEEPSLNTEGAYSDSQTIAKDVAASYSSESQSNKEADSASKVISSTVSFLCELCHEIFTTRQNLFLHFVKANDHHPCQKQFDDETEESKRICLRVFTTSDEAGKQPKTPCIRQNLPKPKREDLHTGGRRDTEDVKRDVGCAQLIELLYRMTLVVSLALLLFDVQHKEKIDP